MPKILIFNSIWIFVIYAIDKYENRMHVHVGKRATRKLCKIWLKPKVELSKGGELTKKEIKDVLEITQQYRDELIDQWQKFMNGEDIDIIKVK